jgi:hypothetical protein
MKRRQAVLTLSLLFLLLIAGCGGGGGRKTNSGDAGDRSVVVAVEWPERSKATRLIPRAAESIAVTITRDGYTVGRVVLNRPSSGGETRATIQRLPVGRLTATATAYPDRNAEGVAQARGQQSVTAEAGRPARITVEMDSTISRVEVNADHTTVFLGDTTQLSATAYDNSGHMVLVGDTLRWSTSGGIADVDEDSGVVYGRNRGDANVTVTETESGIQQTIRVRIKGVGRIEVSPNPVALLEDDFTYITAVAYDEDGYITPLSTAGWLWNTGSSFIAPLFGEGDRIRVDAGHVGFSEIVVRTAAGGEARIPVRVFPSRVSGSLTVSRSGYDGPSTMNVIGEDISASLSETDGSESVSLDDFPVDDYRLVLVELKDTDAAFTDSSKVEFTLRLDGPTAPNGRPYFVFEDSGGPEVTGTLTKIETSQVFRLIVRDPISGEARHRRDRPPRPVPPH